MTYLHDDGCCCPPPPETCFYCSAEPVVSVDNRGACAQHIDDVFAEAGVALKAILFKANEFFGVVPDG